MYTNLSIDVFKKFFSYFCLATYYDEKFELSESDCLAYIRKCTAVDSVAIDPPQFLKDLYESVCMLQKDGMVFVFTHRSFQEFFSAYCLARTKNHLNSILMKISRRPTDNVIKMLYDMDHELLEQEFVLPELKDIVAAVSKFPKERLVGYYSKYLGTEIMVRKDGNEPGLSHGRMSNHARVIDVLWNLYPKIMRAPEEAFPEYQKRDRRVLREHIPKHLWESGKGVRRDQQVFEIRFDPDTLRGQMGVRAEGEFKALKEADWIEETGYAQWCEREIKALIVLLREIEANQGTKNKAIDELLKLGTFGAS